MADIVKLTPEEQVQYEEWVAGRPAVIQEMIKTHPPTKLYRLTTSNQRVTIYSYGEDDTVSVIVSGKYNAVMFDRKVYGIHLSELVECELPPEDEPVGTVLTHPLDVHVFIDATRPLVLNVEQKARLVKELHDKSGLGIMKCQMALIAHNWDIDATVKTLLREGRERDKW